MTRDNKRNGTTILFAAMKVLDGTAMGRNTLRCRHLDFIRFLNERPEREASASKTIHAILDNDAPTSIPTCDNG